MTEPDQTPGPPSLLRHLTAMLYDTLLVIALVLVVYAVALGVLVQLSGDDEALIGPYLGRALIVVSVYGFFCAFWLKDGQTLGMQAWRIKLVRNDGSRVGLGAALLRCVGATLSAACLGLGYLWKLVDRNGRYWHDYLSDTRLVLLPRREKD